MSYFVLDLYQCQRFTLSRTSRVVLVPDQQLLFGGLPTRPDVGGHNR